MKVKTRVLEMVAPLVIRSLVASFSPQFIRDTIDVWIEKIEHYVRETDNKVDDALIPALEAFRKVIEIPVVGDPKPEDPNAAA